MLADQAVMAFVATVDADDAKAFYGDVLGLSLVADMPHALVFDANGTTLRIQKVRDFEPAPFTTLGWQVTDIRATIAALRAKGVEMMRYPAMPQDDDGVMAFGPAQVAWFRDPDGNTLSLTQV